MVITVIYMWGGGGGSHKHMIPQKRAKEVCCNGMHAELHLGSSTVLGAVFRGGGGH